jgi:DNA mismatch repair ATPase MutL
MKNIASYAYNSNHGDHSCRFHIERDIADELYHHIKVVSNQHLSLPPSAMLKNTSTSNQTTSSDDNKENTTKYPQKPAVLFQSLSSQPSPPLKHAFEVNIATPEKKNQTTPISTPLHFAWSPEQPIVTSTPLKKGFRLFRDSPLKLNTNNNMDQSLIDEDDDDSFGDINLSFTRIEAEAIQTKPQKRKWEA